MAGLEISFYSRGGVRLYLCVIVVPDSPLSIPRMTYKWLLSIAWMKMTD
jgi:hypothetical protein